MTAHRVAFLAGRGVGPELTAEASRTLQRVARLHGFALDEVHVPFGTEAVTASGALVPAATRSAVLGADAVLLASRRGPALRVLEEELDLRAAAVRVRHGADGDLLVVHPLDIAAGPWTAERAFAAAGRRTARVAVATDRTLAWEAAADRHPGVAVERLDAAAALRTLVLAPGRFDVVLADAATGPSLAGVAAGTDAERRVVATARLASHGPSVFAAAHGRADEIAGQGVANPSSLLLAASLMLAEGLGEPSAGEMLARAVSAALGNGVRTPDLVTDGVGATTREFTDVVLRLFQVVTPTAEFAREAIA
jgi:3-isopropylmalate dehydrogenase